MDGVVPGRDGDAAAEDRQVIVCVDAVVGGGDADGGAIEDHAGVVPGLDAVFRVADDGQCAVAGEIDAGPGLHLQRRAVVGVGHGAVLAGLIGGVFVVRQRHAAGDDDLRLGFLVHAQRRAAAAGQIQILQHQHHAGDALFHSDAAVGAFAADDIGARFADLHLAAAVADGEVGGVCHVRLQRGGGVLCGAVDDLRSAFGALQRRLLPSGGHAAAEALALRKLLRRSRKLARGGSGPLLGGQRAHRQEGADQAHDQGRCNGFFHTVLPP